jgi:4-amino-4-deoxy-L-arabinose transferase-like glycosyltransferase
VRSTSPHRRITRNIIWLCLAAFLLRLAAVLISPGHFWAYTVYYDMAKVLAEGGGYCLEPGRLCAYFPPVYPTILAAGILTGHPQTAIMLFGSLIGVGTVWLTWLSGRSLFGPLAGFLAACYAAIYPYFVWHDAVIQETGILALAVTASIYLLVRAHNTDSRPLWLAAGVALALTVLTKANLLLFVPAALLWLAFFSAGPAPLRARRFAWAALGVALLLGPWVLRTWRITGTPILYSNGGFSLWTSNHRLTFDYFPERSIDEAHIPEWNDMKPEERRDFDTLPDDPHGILQTRWYWNKGMAFIEANPGLTFIRGIRKIWIAFSPRFSPAKSGAFQALYLASYLPLLVLAVFGIWRSRARWRELGYIYVLIGTFAAGSAVLWAHTSHRMYLEPCLMILAASVFREHATREHATGTSTPAVGIAAVGKEN